MDAIELTAFHFQDWMKDYIYDPKSDPIFFKAIESKGQTGWKIGFTVSSWDKSPAAALFPCHPLNPFL